MGIIRVCDQLRKKDENRTVCESYEVPELIGWRTLAAVSGIVAGLILLWTSLFIGDYLLYAASVVAMMTPAAFFIILVSVENAKARKEVEEVLQDQLEKRLATIKAMGNGYDLYALLRVSLEETRELLLRFYGDHAYTIFLFAGKEAPDVVAYCDTNGRIAPSSKAKRDEDPEYYCKEGYSECGMLAGAISEERYVTLDVARDEQHHPEEHMAAHVMFRVTDDVVLSIACDKPSVFKKKALFAFKMARIVKQLRLDIAISELFEAEESRVVHHLLQDKPI